MDELERQSRVFFDDSETEEGETTDDEHGRQSRRRGAGQNGNGAMEFARSVSGSPSLSSGDEGRVPMDGIEERML